jgi:hypothetical protein
VIIGNVLRQTNNRRCNFFQKMYFIWINSSGTIPCLLIGKYLGQSEQMLHILVFYLLVDCNSRVPSHIIKIN